jgi:hypothetical protein
MATSAARLGANSTRNRTPGKQKGETKETDYRENRTEAGKKEQAQRNEGSKDRGKAGESERKKNLESTKRAKSEKGKYIMLVRHAKVTR